MVDALFEHRRLVAVYDALEGDRSDLDAYAAIAEELGARRVLDVGCGTGTFALRLAGMGLQMTGVDPAGGSLRYARSRPGAERVAWLHGDATALPPLQVDLATMTANVAQAIVDADAWRATLRGVHRSLRPGGHLVLETRDPAYGAWRGWTRAQTYRTADVPGIGVVEGWEEVSDVSWPLVTFTSTRVFGSDGAVLTSGSTLRFRERDEVAEALSEAGYDLEDVRGAPDRVGRELVFLARRSESGDGVH